MKQQTIIRDGFISSGNAQITGSLIVSSTITGNLTGNASTATTASFASTASYVNKLNQSLIITSSLAVGAGSLGPNENTLTLGARDAGSEGGQLGLNAPGGTYTSASMIDNYNNFFRILKGTNAGSTNLVAQWNLHTYQMQLPAYTGASSFSGTATANLAVDSSGNVITVSTSGGSVFPYTGNAVITGSLTTTGIISVPINGAAYFRGGDDAEFWDVNVANTVGIYGQQTQGIGAVKLGSGGPTLYGSGSRLGIGTTGPTATVDINGNLYVASGITGSLQGTATTASYISPTFISASAAASGFSGGGGSGTVNSGNSSKLAYYPSTGDTVDDATNLEYDGTNLKLTSTSQLDFYTNAGSIYFGNFSSPSYGRVGFSVPGAAVMVVDYNTARAGFGGGINLITSAPAGLVEIQGKADEIQLLVKGNGTQNNNVFEIRDSNSNQILTLDNSGVFNTAGGGTSDRRKKDNIMYLSYNHSNTINALKPAKFEFKNNPGVTRHGFIAQDVLEVRPELVLGNGEEENGTYGLDYDGILAITVKSLQEALARITQLEQTIEELKQQK
jgi:hypothetical protein